MSWLNAYCLLIMATMVAIAAGQTLQTNQGAILANIVKPSLDPKNVSLDTWVTENQSCEQWRGVKCNGSGIVIGIDLTNCSLSGSIPSALGNIETMTFLNLSNNRLSGIIPEELGDLNLLRELNLSNNNLAGSLPSSILSIEQLTVLDLSSNLLSESVPSVEILANLQELDLHNNSFEGPFPDGLAALVSLTRLDLGNNSFSGNVFGPITNLQNLTHLRLAALKLQEEIPTNISSLVNLIELNLSDNELMSGIPSVLGALTALETLSLANNKLSGSIPDSFSSLLALKSLDLNNNTISGGVDTVLPNLTNLETLDLGFTSLNGEFPVALQPLGNLLRLALSGNSIDGPLPDIFSSFSRLEFLDLSSNNFSGSLPPSLGLLQNLSVFSIEDNAMSGTIPTYFQSLTNLWYLGLGGNTFSGLVPDYSGHPNLSYLFLYSNNLTGGIPSSISQIKNATLIVLDNNDLQGSLPVNLSQASGLAIFSCSGCSLVGDLPEDLGSGESILLVRLSGNMINGTIPTSLLTSETMIILDLSQNALSGPIPDAFTKNHSLAYLDLSSNALTGYLPTTLSNLKNLLYVDLGANMLTGSIPTSYGLLGGGKGGTLTNFSLHSNLLEGSVPLELGNLTSLQSLQLNNNSLTSTLPVELGALEDLIVMDLSNNSFFGSIPSSFGNFTRLQDLSMSACGFSKSIPNLQNLSSLLKLDLSYNRLEGDLPTLPDSGNILTIDLHNNFLTGNLTFESGNLTNLQALVLGQNFLEGSIPTTLIQQAPRLSLLSLVGNDLVGPVPENLLAANSLTLELFGNQAICTSSIMTNNNATLYKACQIPTELSYTAPPICPELACNNNNTPNPAIYFNTNSQCQCGAPLRATIKLTSTIFVVFTTNVSVQLATDLASELELDVTQVRVASANPAPGFAQIVFVQFFPLVGRLTDSEISKISIGLENITLSFYLGSAQLLNLTLPPISSTIGVPPPAPPPAVSKGLRSWSIAIIVVGSFLFIVIVALGLIIWWKPARIFGPRGSTLQKQTSFAIRVQDHFVKSVPLELVLAATDNFSEANFLGSGGYGTVYKGRAPNGQMWAVKRAKTITEKGLRAFQNEVDAMSKMSHANLVRLLGYCDENNEQILIYDFIPNGTLRSRMKKSPGELPPLTFEERLEIALGSAEGLRYLHSFANPTIIHRDVKSENILLDDKLQAKIADFGLLKDNPLDVSEDEAMKTRLAGTPGYIDPQYYHTFQVTTRSDVYSFGVVLLELITGRGALLRELPNTGEEDFNPGNIIKLVDWVDGHNFLDYVDENLIYPPRAMGALLELTFKCLEETSAGRPDMEEVVLTLGQIKASIRGGNEGIRVSSVSTDHLSYGMAADIESKAPGFDTAPLITSLQGR